jgi:hypothetical protein
VRGAGPGRPAPRPLPGLRGPHLPRSDRFLLQYACAKTLRPSTIWWGRRAGRLSGCPSPPSWVRDLSAGLSSVAELCVHLLLSKVYDGLYLVYKGCMTYTPSYITVICLAMCVIMYEGVCLSRKNLCSLITLESVRRAVPHTISLYGTCVSTHTTHTGKLYKCCTAVCEIRGGNSVVSHDFRRVVYGGLYPFETMRRCHGATVYTCQLITLSHCCIRDSVCDYHVPRVHTRDVISLTQAKPQRAPLDQPRVLLAT